MVATDAFKDSYYREFPVPDVTAEWTADQIDFWCSNKPANVFDSILCHLDQFEDEESPPDIEA